MPLYDILNEFQKGHSHMAVVVKYNMEKSKHLKIDRELKLERKKTQKMKKKANKDQKHSRSKKLRIFVSQIFTCNKKVRTLLFSSEVLGADLVIDSQTFKLSCEGVVNFQCFRY